MAQILVRKIDDSVKETLRANAKAHGRSLEEEARSILTSSALGGSRMDAAVTEEFGFGTRIHERFKRIGLSDEDFAAFEEAIESNRGAPVRAADLE